jgi:hypothetical protein
MVNHARLCVWRDARRLACGVWRSARSSEQSLFSTLQRSVMSCAGAASVQPPIALNALRRAICRSHGAGSSSRDRRQQIFPSDGAAYAERQTPNAKRQTPNAKRQTPNTPWHDWRCKTVSNASDERRCNPVSEPFVDYWIDSRLGPGYSLY